MTASSSAPVESARERPPEGQRAHPAPPAHSLRGHMPALDGVRGLAILMVLLLHFVGNSVPTGPMEEAVVWVMNYGSYGVDLFFILSGFLITGILCDAREKPHFFRNFYMRRVLRIFPLYYAVLVALFVVLPLVPGLRSSALDELQRHQLWVWAYGVNIFNGIRGEYSLPYIDHFWSLSVEEHFYFIWPFLVWVLGRWPRALMGATFALALAALTGRIAASVAGVSPVTLFVLTPFRLDGLALGGFLAVYSRQPGGAATIARMFPRVAAVAGTLLVGSFAWNRFTPVAVEWMRPIRGSLFLVLLAALLLWALLAPPSSRAARFFTSRPMVFLGVYSYGLYVYHHFIAFYFIRHATEFEVARLLGLPHAAAVGLQAVLGIAASVALAYASYHLIEKHPLSLKRLWSSGR